MDTGVNAGLSARVGAAEAEAELGKASGANSGERMLRIDLGVGEGAVSTRGNLGVASDERIRVKLGKGVGKEASTGVFGGHAGTPRSCAIT